MYHRTSFNSKLLLFGEYGLMFDAMALSVPFPKFNGRLAFGSGGLHRESTAEIRKFFDHLKQGVPGQNLNFPFDFDRLDADLRLGLYFDSNIPQQYGVGSSGALVAALFTRYADLSKQQGPVSPEMLKINFAVLESFFHGRSSGLDPLISYLNKPILIDPKKQIVPVEFDLAQTGIVVALIDTQTTGATGPLVRHFIDRFNDPAFERAFESQFIPANNGCITALRNGDKTVFFGYLEQLIRYQLRYFRRMIPENFHSTISEALNEQVFIKLLGSGGGGFLLAFANTRQQMEGFADRHDFELIYV